MTSTLLRSIAVVACVLAVAGSGHAQTRTLVVGSSATYPPFAYETPSKEIVGYDVDMIKAIARRPGCRCGS